MRHPKRAEPLGGLIETVARTLGRRRLMAARDSVLVALSAGPDSTALLAAMAHLRDQGRIGEVYALHVDHGLRAGGDLDAACALETCGRFGVPFESVRVEVGEGNLQAAARRVRYRALRSAAARRGATRIATGHTLTDQAETFLLRALRGSGARGLAAIPPRRGAIIRPLIDVARDEVLRFLEGQRLRWREDPTNASPRFARNALRLQLNPVLRRLEPGFERALARAADLLRDDERALARLARPRVAADGSVEVAALLAEPRAVRRRAVRLLWKSAARGRRPLPAAQVEAILNLCARPIPGRLSLPGRLVAQVARGRLTVGAEPPRAARTPRDGVSVAGPGSYRCGDLIVEIGLVTGEPAPFPLVLRGRRPGDRIRPELAPGGKKLKAWLIDRKVPRERRDALLLLADGEGNVIAIPELGIRSRGAGSLSVTVRPAAP